MRLLWDASHIANQSSSNLKENMGVSCEEEEFNFTMDTASAMVQDDVKERVFCIGASCDGGLRRLNWSCAQTREWQERVSHMTSKAPTRHSAKRRKPNIWWMALRWFGWRVCRTRNGENGWYDVHWFSEICVVTAIQKKSHLRKSQLKKGRFVLLEEPKRCNKRNESVSYDGRSASARRSRERKT